MQVAIPHDLEKPVIRERMKANSHKIADHIPGGFAKVETQWPSEDRMAMTINAMGQVIKGNMDIEDSRVVFTMDLPPALGFLQPMIESTLRHEGEKLIAP